VVTIDFDNGTLLINGKSEEIHLVVQWVSFDKRVNRYRARASDYAFIVLAFHKAKIPYEDRARTFNNLELTHNSSFQPRSHQKAAFDSWTKGGSRGVCVMPTGSGKSFLARMAIEKISRSTLVVVPTIDLMIQWARQLEEAFGMEIGMLGGGSKEVREITVSTYDSAVIQMEFIGGRFGLLIFDECHHLPGPMNRLAALFSIAPYRLGLTATPEHEQDHILYELLGPKLFEIHIDQLEGSVLAPYQIESIPIELTEDEALEYEEARAVYTGFLRSQNIDFRNKGAWGQFIVRCFTVKEGREAFRAYQRQKQIARTSKSKLNTLWKILQKHPGERMIVFTADNDTAYTLGRKFYLPVITHHTKAAERKEMLDRFRDGTYTVLVTSKVLNEGIDVPEASVGVILSGSGSTREHVQRLGRILRPSAGKTATLYELVSIGTSETYVSERRRQHRAYEKFNSGSTYRQ